MALRGALGSGLGAPWSRVTPRNCAWQAWHNLTSTFVSRGRRGTISHPQAFRVAGVALMALRGALGSGLGAPWSRVTRGIVRGRRGTWWHPFRFTWQEWHPWHSVARLGLVWWHPLSFHVAGVAQSHIHKRFAWQAWHPPSAGQMLNLVELEESGATYSQTTYSQTTYPTYIHTYINYYLFTYLLALSHTLFHIPLCHTHNCFNFSILHHILCLSFLPRPRHNLWSSLLEEVDLGLSGPLIFVLCIGFCFWM